MRFITIFILLLFISCSEDNFQNEACNDVRITEEEKLRGGSILQVFILAGPEYKGIDIKARTNANWISLSPLLNLLKNNSGTYRPYKFPVSQETFKMRIALENIISSGVRNIMIKPLTSFNAVSDLDFWGDFFLKSEEEWQEMERTYTDLFLGYAALSLEFQEFKMLSIGNELREFATRRPEFFKGLIVRLRDDYPNLRLTYSANWDEYNSIAFWKDLDYIGVNSYFPLIAKMTPEVDEIKEAFAPIKEDLEALSCSAGRPVLFTEYGFRSIDYNLRRPWEHGNPQIGVNVNFEAQANAYTAFFDTFWDEPWIAGGFFWEWYTESDINTPSFPVNENGWYINGKPTEQLVRERYANQTN